MTINIGGILTKRAFMTPDREALVCEDIRRTYRQLNERANRLANTMKSLGVGHGDRVGLVIPNVPAFAVWYYAALRIGAIAVSVNTRLTGEEVAFSRDVLPILSDPDLYTNWTA